MNKKTKDIMDRPIEKKSFPRRYAGYIAAAVVAVALLAWLIFGSTASTMTIDSNEITISDEHGESSTIM